MGFSIGGFKLPEIKLPKLDLSGIDLSKGVEALKNVAQDMFAPSTDGKTLFNKELQYKVGPFDIRLKNPVEALSEKLLGKLSDKLKSMGFNTEALASMLTGKRQVEGAGEIDLPKLTERTSEYVAEIGGGTNTQSTADVEDVEATEETGDVEETAEVAEAEEAEVEAETKTTSSSSAGSSSVTGSVASAISSGDSLSGALGALAGKANSMGQSVTDMISSWDGKDQKKMFEIQEAMQARNAMYTLLTNLMQMEHETRKQIINNIR